MRCRLCVIVETKLCSHDFHVYPGAFDSVALSPCAIQDPSIQPYFSIRIEILLMSDTHELGQYSPCTFPNPTLNLRVWLYT